MPKLNLTIPHTLTPDVATSRIRGLLNDLKAEHGDKISDLQEEWVKDTGKFACTVMGFRVAGVLAIEPSHVAITGTLPLAAMLFKSQLETLIKKHAAELLA
ncbi:MAG: polyhydroxyalkanoic acid system family protein [bacterium]